jgi:hypothetical protein
VLGNVAFDTVRRQFRPHPTFLRQRDWHQDGIESCLRPAPQLEQAPAGLQGGSGSLEKS